ncbi:MAG: pyridoxamine 5'-phosphate oxidase family protein [Candidatus Limnocylindrales bacterium]
MYPPHGNSAMDGLRQTSCFLIVSGWLPGGVHGATIPGMNRDVAPAVANRIDRLLHQEPVVWLSSVRPDGRPHLVPIWFSWDGREILIASKPNAQKIRNLRANPGVMLALGETEEDFDVGLLEGRAELLDAPSAAILPASHCTKYERQMAAIGLSKDEFLATYSQVIRIVPTRFLPWHGRTTPASADRGWPIDRRLAASIRRVASAIQPRQALASQV